MHTIEVSREDLWKYREVHEILKVNNKKVTKSKPLGKFIKKNKIKNLDFKTYCVESLFVHKLFDENEDYIELPIFNLEN